MKTTAADVNVTCAKIQRSFGPSWPRVHRLTPVLLYLKTGITWSAVYRTEQWRASHALWQRYCSYAFLIKDIDAVPSESSLFYEISLFRNRVHSTLRSKRFRGIFYAVRFLTARKFGRDVPVPNFRKSKKQNTRKTSRKALYTSPKSFMFLEVFLTTLIYCLQLHRH